MSKWFVFSNLDYYPYATIVEAETPEEALPKDWDRERYPGADPQFEPFVVFPLDAVALDVHDCLKGIDDEY